MIRLDRPVIVEGKYDKIALENVIDALIIPTNGFRIFKDKEKCRLIRSLAQKNGIIIMTDSDSAGAVLRSYIKNIVGNAEIINVYIPCLKGKEKRKSAPSKEGFLGVEGVSKEVLIEALRRSGITDSNTTKRQKEITKLHLFEVGLSGGKNSLENRREFLKYLNLPENLTPNAMLDILNNMFSLNEFGEVCEKWQEKKTKN